MGSLRKMIEAVGEGQGMHISVAICTWNRATLLDKTLTAMCALQIPADISWELIIVNNNCTDNTVKIIQKHCKDLPIVLLFEPKQGLSNARNAAVAGSLGEYIIWTDDDVLVEDGWIEGYVNAFRSHPEAVLFGGPVQPWFEGEPPAWILEGWETVSSSFATRDFGEVPFMLDSERLPFGANFAVKASEQRSVLYDPNFGLSHGKIVLGEETLVMKHLLSRGLTGWWVPASKVQHWIPTSRQRVAYVRKYFMGYGRTLVRQSKSVPFGLLNKPKWLWRKAIQSELKYYYDRLFKSPQTWTCSLKIASINWGCIFDGNK
jgi:glycosyltransferase involved in cell wall biosynthesis